MRNFIYEINTDNLRYENNMHNFIHDNERRNFRYIQHITILYTVQSRIENFSTKVEGYVKKATFDIELESSGQEKKTVTELKSQKRKTNLTQNQKIRLENNFYEEL